MISLLQSAARGGPASRRPSPSSAPQMYTQSKHAQGTAHRSRAELHEHLVAQMHSDDSIPSLIVLPGLVPGIHGIWQGVCRDPWMPMEPSPWASTSTWALAISAAKTWCPEQVRARDTHSCIAAHDARSYLVPIAQLDNLGSSPAKTKGVNL